jgi:hypothetical protein
MEYWEHVGRNLGGLGERASRTAEMQGRVYKRERARSPWL